MGGFSISRQYIVSTIRSKSMTKNPIFNVGDIVKLKSSGPDMTVKGYRSHIVDYDKKLKEEELVCQWFSGSKLQLGYFNPDSVEKVG